MPRTTTTDTGDTTTEGEREMDGNREPPAVAAQRAAIQDVRARYERGELTYETFRRALDALVLARDADECRAILDALPTSPLSALAALDTPPPPISAPVSTSAPLEHKRIIAFMSQIRKLRRPWQLAASAHAVAFMGEVKLDLGLAELPPQAALHVTAFMGTVIIYVPRTVRVAVRTTVFMGETQALGERVGGVIVTGHEEYVPASGTPTPQLDIEAVNFMGSVKVILTDGRPPVSISELVRNALRAVATGARQGLRDGARQYPSLPSRENWD